MVKMRSMVAGDDTNGATRAPRWRTAWTAFALCTLVAAVMMGGRIYHSSWDLSPHAGHAGQNTALAEAFAWLNGRLDLAEDYYEDAEYDGRHYNMVGLAFTIISTPVVWVGRQLAWADPFPSALHAALMVLPVWCAAFFAFLTVSRSPYWAALMQLGFTLGTPLTACIIQSRSGSIYIMNNVLAVTGLFLIGGDLLGQRRIWPAIIGLCLAGWSRQLTCLYALPILWLTYRDWRAARHIPARRELKPADHDEQCAARRAQCVARRRLIWAVAGVGMAAAVPMTLNAAKFSSPLDSGYGYIYEAHRTDPDATRGRAALFSLDYMPMHLYAMNIAHPPWDIRQGKLHLDMVDARGGSIWLTSPLTIGVLLTARRWWRDSARRALMLCSIPVIAGLITYHTFHGEDGYYRYALDFLPLWWLVMAPCLESWPVVHRWCVAAAGYGILYFQMLPG